MQDRKRGKVIVITDYNNTTQQIQITNKCNVKQQQQKQTGAYLCCRIHPSSNLQSVSGCSCIDFLSLTEKVSGRIHKRSQCEISLQNQSFSLFSTNCLLQKMRTHSKFRKASLNLLFKSEHDENSDFCWIRTSTTIPKRR